MVVGTVPGELWVDLSKLRVGSCSKEAVCLKDITEGLAINDDKCRFRKSID